MNQSKQADGDVKHARVVKLADGYNGHTVEFFAAPLEVDGETVKLRCAEPGKQYMTAWRSQAVLQAALATQGLAEEVLQPGVQYVFFNETGSCITTWCAEGRVDSPVTHYLESGFKATHWCAVPTDSDSRWRTGNPWDHPEAQDVDVLTLCAFYPSGRLGVSHERKRPGARRDVNHPVFAGARAWMLAEDLRAHANPVPDRRRKVPLNLKPGGTPNITGWRKGDRLTALTGVKVGDVLLNVCEQFNAQNLVRITRLGNNIVGPDEIAYGMFCDPANESNARAPGDIEFSIWDCQLSGTREAFYRASRY